MARHRHRRSRSHYGSKSLVPGISNTVLYAGVALGYYLMTRPATVAAPTGAAGLGLLHPDGMIMSMRARRRLGRLGYVPVGTRPIGPGLGAWGRPVLPVAGRSAGLGQFFRGFAGGLGAWGPAQGMVRANYGGADYSMGRPLIQQDLNFAQQNRRGVLIAVPTHPGATLAHRLMGLGSFEATHGFWPAHMQGGLGALVRTIHGHMANAGLGTVHVTEYGNEFVGGRPRGMGRFNNVSINRRWWT